MLSCVLVGRAYETLVVVGEGGGGEEEEEGIKYSLPSYRHDTCIRTCMHPCITLNQITKFK